MSLRLENGLTQSGASLLFEPIGIDLHLDQSGTPQTVINGAPFFTGLNILGSITGTGNDYITHSLASSGYYELTRHDTNVLGMDFNIGDVSFNPHGTQGAGVNGFGTFFCRVDNQYLKIFGEGTAYDAEPYPGMQIYTPNRLNIVSGYSISLGLPDKYGNNAVYIKDVDSNSVFYMDSSGVFRQFGYITAPDARKWVENYINVNGYYYTTPQDANVLGWKIGMPVDLLTNSLTTTGTGTFGTGIIGTSINNIKLSDVPSLSYSNPGGTGDRRASITLATNITFRPGYTTYTNFINGDTTESNLIFDNQTAVGKYLSFDFGVGASKVITEAKFYQSSADGHGTFKWQGSNNGSSWTDIGSTFVLGAGAATQTITTMSANTTGYRYYRILGTSDTGGPMNYNQFVREFEFKIDDALNPANSSGQIQAYKVDGATAASLYVNPSGGSLLFGSSTSTYAFGMTDTSNGILSLYDSGAGPAMYVEVAGNPLYRGLGTVQLQRTTGSAALGMMFEPYGSGANAGSAYSFLAYENYVSFWAHKGTGNFTGADNVFVITNDHNVGIDTGSTALTNAFNVGTSAQLGIDSSGNLVTSGDVKSATYHVGTDAGIDATVTYVDTLLGAKTLTFKKGILTAQT